MDMNRIFAIIFGSLGGMTGFSLNQLLFSIFTESANTIYVYICGIAFAALFALIFTVGADYIYKKMQDILDEAELLFNVMTMKETGQVVLGGLTGLAAANLISIPLYGVRYFGVTFVVMLNIALCYMGCGFAVQKLKTARLQAEENIIFVDTSAIIDGRIVDLYMTGFIQKRLVVPDCVVDELQRLADSNDGTKRSKGKRGLDILNTMKERFGSGIEVNKYNYGTIIGVDNRLIMLCEHNANTILTVDYNLNRSAKVRGIHVLNVNELCNVLKPVALPGDTLNVTVMKEGKEQGQGVGFLDDGTMIVIENGRKYIGENISIQVTTALQTDAGRLIFGRHA